MRWGTFCVICGAAVPIAGVAPQLYGIRNAFDGQRPPDSQLSLNACTPEDNSGVAHFRILIPMRGDSRHRFWTIVRASFRNGTLRWLRVAVAAEARLNVHPRTNPTERAHERVDREHVDSALQEVGDERLTNFKDRDPPFRHVGDDPPKLRH
jgi:hypothetical protein